MSDWSAKNPHDSTVTVNYVLNGAFPEETRHDVFGAILEWNTKPVTQLSAPATSTELVDDVIVALGQQMKLLTLMPGK